MKTFLILTMACLIFGANGVRADEVGPAPVGSTFALSDDLVFTADQYSRSIFFDNGTLTQRMTWWKLPKTRPSTDSIVCDLNIGFYDQMLPVRVKKITLKLDHYGEYKFEDGDSNVLVLSGLERPLTVRCGNLDPESPMIAHLVTPTIEVLQKAFGHYISVLGPAAGENL